MGKYDKDKWYTEEELDLVKGKYYRIRSRKDNNGKWEYQLGYDNEGNPPSGNTTALIMPDRLKLLPVSPSCFVEYAYEVDPLRNEPRVTSARYCLFYKDKEHPFYDSGFIPVNKFACGYELAEDIGVTESSPNTDELILRKKS